MNDIREEHWELCGYDSCMNLELNLGTQDPYHRAGGTPYGEEHCWAIAWAVDGTSRLQQPAQLSASRCFVVAVIINLPPTRDSGWEAGEHVYRTDFEVM